MTTSTILAGLAATIANGKKLLGINDAKYRAECRQQARDWQTTFCTIHHTLKFRDLAKVQKIKPQTALDEAQCYTCSLCEIEHNRESLAKRQLMSDNPNFVRGSVFLSVKQVEREQQQDAIRQVAIARIPTLPRSTGEIPQIVKTLIPQANIPTLPPPRATGSLPAKDIVYALTQRSDDDEDKTEMRPAIRLPRMIQKTTGDLRIEVLLDVLAQPTSPHQTGEQEKLPAKIEDGAFLL